MNLRPIVGGPWSASYPIDPELLKFDMIEFGDLREMSDADEKLLKIDLRSHQDSYISAEAIRPV
jgi:hypothetical protein